MKKVHITYFVHGTTTDNEAGLSSGWSDVGLSDLGKKQNLDLKELIKRSKFDIVFTSDLRRAKETANFVFNGTKIIEDKRLRELNYGVLQGAREEEIVYEKHISNRFPNGESLKDVEKRMKEFLDYLKNNYSGKHVAVVAHKAPQLALDVLLNGMTWNQAIENDWRHKKAWKPGWDYLLEC
ncbi:MAG: histidine phosphatase family protein [Candidatus Aenigmarchaeota archaeon]|nr:histidine phosphatase family protein [Candidatus Aenigmarchaeota archaeon]